MAGYGMIRVATWNVWGRFGPWEERWPAIVDELRALDPDVIALQETWRDEERTQARLLADELGYPHWAHEDVEQVDGIAIVSRLPLIAKRRAVRTTVMWTTIRLISVDDCLTLRPLHSHAIRHDVDAP